MDLAAREHPPQTLVTIGVYGYDEESFLDALRNADVQVLIDVRQRRGVRGSEYAWANAERLQAALADAGIDYRHVKELAPTTELRQLQYAEDARAGVAQRSRGKLAPVFSKRYTREILEPVGVAAIVDALPANGRAALLCVERAPEACHRSLIAAHLETSHGLGVQHLRT